MHTTATPRKMSCFLPEGTSAAQIVMTPSADSTATATRMGQLVAIASCCQKFLITVERRVLSAGESLSTQHFQANHSAAIGLAVGFRNRSQAVAPRDGSESGGKKTPKVRRSASSAGVHCAAHDRGASAV